MKKRNLKIGEFETTLDKTLYTILGVSKSKKYIVSKQKSSGRDFFQIWKRNKRGSFLHHGIICGGFDVNEINKLWLDEYKAA